MVSPPSRPRGAWVYDAAMQRHEVEGWLRGYEAAWRAGDVDAPLRELFHEDATYRMGPYEPVHTGLPAIAELWVAERQGPDEAFTMDSEILAVDGNVAVVRLEVAYGPPISQEYRDLWVLRFAGDGRCLAFEEWPYWPDEGILPTGDG